MEISEREKHIKVLEKLLKEAKEIIEFYSENKNIDLTKEKEIEETLAYAISSLKTDLKYDLMYEGEDIYTKDEVMAMLTELQTEIEEKHREEEFMNDWSSGYNSCLVDGYNSIQQKIEQLKGELK